MSRPSLKKTLISKLSMVPNIKELENNHVNLLTPAGIISGKLFKYSDSDNPSTTSDILAKLTNKITTEYKETYSLELPLPENDGFIMLQEVSLRKIDSVAVTNLPLITVFYDQIIGIFLGNITVN